jgi:hypothetical protein
MPTLEELQCLILAVDRDAEMVMLRQIYDLIEVHGCERVFQMVTEIHDVWVDSDNLRKYQAPRIYSLGRKR